MKKTKIFSTIFLILVCVISGFAFTPQSDINMRNFYSMFDVVNVSADNFIGTLIGSFTIGNNVNYNNFSLLNASDVCTSSGLCLSNVSNVNKSYVDSQDILFNLSMTTYVDVQDVLFNDSITVYIDAQNILFNISITSYVDSQDVVFNDSMKNYVDAQDVLFNDSMKTYVDNLPSADVNKSYVDAQDVTFNDSMKVYADSTFIFFDNESFLNVNSSLFWDGISSQGSIVLNWTQLTNYPAGCPANTFVTQVGDTITCTGISDVYLLNDGDTATGNYSFDTNTLIIDSTNNRIGIGITSPEHTLHVVGDTKLEGIINITGEMYLGSSVVVAQNGNFEGNMVIDGNLTVLGDFANVSVSTQYLNGTFRPSLNNQFDIGTSLFEWKDGYFSGTLNALDINAALNADNLTSGTVPSARIADDYLLNDGDTATGNYIFTDEITSIEKISFEADSVNHAITDNSTCIIITGDTSTFNIC